MKTIKLLFVVMVLATGFAKAQEVAVQENLEKNALMKTYVIERVIPGAGDLTPEQLKGISQTSCTVINEMGPVIEWQHSYVTGDKVYCVYKADKKERIEEHAKTSGFPANAINEVVTVIGPATAEI